MGLTTTVLNPLAATVPAEWNEFVRRERLPPVWRADVLVAAGWCAPHPASMVLVRDRDDAVALFHAGLADAGRRGAVRVFGRGLPVLYREVPAGELPPLAGVMPPALVDWVLRHRAGPPPSTLDRTTVVRLHATIAEALERYQSDGSRPRRAPAPRDLGIPP